MQIQSKVANLGGGETARAAAVAESLNTEHSRTRFSPNFRPETKIQLHPLCAKAPHRQEAEDTSFDQLVPALSHGTSPTSLFPTGGKIKNLAWARSCR